MKILKITKRKSLHNSYCMTMPSGEIVLASGVVVKNCFYGTTPFGLTKTMEVDVKIAEKYVKAFYETFWDVRNYMNEFREHAQRHGWVQNMFGKKRRFPTLMYIGADSKVHKQMNGAINAPIQGDSGICTIKAMTEIHKEFRRKGMKSRILNNVHDSILLEFYIPELEEAVKITLEGMTRKYYENRKGNRVTLDAELKLGEIWGFGKSLEYWKKNPEEFKKLCNPEPVTEVILEEYDPYLKWTKKKH